MRIEHMPHTPERQYQIPANLSDATIERGYDIGAYQTVFDLAFALGDLQASRQVLEQMEKHAPDEVWPNHYLQLHGLGDPAALNEALSLALSDLDARIVNYWGSDGYEHDRIAFQRIDVANACLKAERWDDVMQVVELLPLSAQYDNRPLRKQFVQHLQRHAFFANDTERLTELLDSEEVLQKSTRRYFQEPPDYPQDQYLIFRARTGDEQATQQLRDQLANATDNYFAYPAEKSTEKDEDYRVVLAGHCVNKAMSLVIAGIEDNWTEILDFAVLHYLKYNHKSENEASRPFIKLQHLLSDLIYHNHLHLAGIPFDTFEEKIFELFSQYDIDDPRGFFLRGAKRSVPGKERNSQDNSNPAKELIHKLRRIPGPSKTPLDLKKYQQLGVQLNAEDLELVPDLHVRLAGYLGKVASGDVELINPAMESSGQLMLAEDRFDYLLQLMQAFVNGSVERAEQTN
jgi:hypothetical protein